MMKHRKYLILAMVASLLVALDQLTKLYVHTHFELGEFKVVWEGFFNITYIRNTGAAFGFLRDSHPSFREIFFLSMPPLAMLTILLILRGVEDRDHLQILALSSIFGGAIGNYLDRIRFGFVVDFLDFHWKDFYSFPAFNVADSAIVVGVFFLIFIIRKSPQKALSTPAGSQG
jgi:signal peptidase II